MSACLVPNCPALAVEGEKCALHQFAMTAKEAGVVDSTCPSCRRKFLKGDYVMRAADELVGKQKSLTVSRWRHVADCHVEKRPTKREMAESPKPLWDEVA